MYWSLYGDLKLGSMRRFAAATGEMFVRGPPKSPVKLNNVVTDGTAARNSLASSSL
jgi:hypothetical protein